MKKERFFLGMLLAPWIGGLVGLTKQCLVSFIHVF